MHTSGFHLIAGLAVSLLLLLSCSHVADAEDERDVAELTGPERYPIEDGDDVIPVDFEGAAGDDEGEAWLEGEDEEGFEEGKRGRMFVGKRGRTFVGKRGRMFVGKRGRMFVGKRGRMFVGKRRIILRPISRVDRSTAEETNQKLADDHVANVATIVKRSVAELNMRPM